MTDESKKAIIFERATNICLQQMLYIKHPVPIEISYSLLMLQSRASGSPEVTSTRRALNALDE